MLTVSHRRGISPRRRAPVTRNDFRLWVNGWWIAMVLGIRVSLVQTPGHVTSSAVQADDDSDEDYDSEP